MKTEPIRKQIARKICAEAQVNLDTLPKFYQDRNLTAADEILTLPSGLPNLSLADLLELVEQKRVRIVEQTWEHPLVPSAELSAIFNMAEKFREALQDPSVRLEHFLFAAMVNEHPYRAEAITKWLAEIGDNWRNEVESQKEEGK